MRSGNLGLDRVACKPKKDFPMFGTNVIVPYFENRKTPLTGKYINYFRYKRDGWKNRYCLIQVDGYNDNFFISVTPEYLYIDLDKFGVSLKKQFNLVQRNCHLYLLKHLKTGVLHSVLQCNAHMSARVFNQEKRVIYNEYLPEFKIYEAFDKKECSLRRKLALEAVGITE